MKEALQRDSLVCQIQNYNSDADADIDDDNKDEIDDHYIDVIQALPTRLFNLWKLNDNADADHDDDW